jgi:hypothetical protein
LIRRASSCADIKEAEEWGPSSKGTLMWLARIELDKHDQE